MKKILLLLGILLIGVLLFACAPKAVHEEKAAAPETVAITKATWEVEWEKTLAMAKKEGKVSIVRTVGIDPEMRRAFIEGMKKYGLGIEMTSGRGGELAAKILTEQRAGIYTIDIYIGGTTTVINQLKPAGVLDSLEPALILPEVTDPKAWWEEKGVLWVDKDKTLLASGAYPGASISFNTSLVKPEEVKAYKDLLSPRWKGKISINDPTVAGAGNKWFCVTGIKIMGWDFMRSLVKQEPIICRDQRQQVDWMAHGKYPIAIAADPMMIAEFVRAGSPILQVSAEEGVGLLTGAGGVCLLTNAPHPNAARVFINWFLSKEGQTKYAESNLTQSGRLDVSTENIPAASVRKSGVKYFWIEREEYIRQEGIEGMKMASEIFGPLLR